MFYVYVIIHQNGGVVKIGGGYFTKVHVVFRRTLMHFEKITGYGDL